MSLTSDSHKHLFWVVHTHTVILTSKIQIHTHTHTHFPRTRACACTPTHMHSRTNKRTHAIVHGLDVVSNFCKTNVMVVGGGGGWGMRAREKTICLTGLEHHGIISSSFFFSFFFFFARGQQDLENPCFKLSGGKGNNSISGRQGSLKKQKKMELKWNVNGLQTSNQRMSP